MFTKPVPSDIDEWTHFLHGSDNNAVARDTRVGPPQTLQWTAAPVWTRNHETSPGVYGMVSSRGRLFYVLDEGPIGIVSPRLPDKMALIARDAFNGVQLWRKELKSWLPSSGGGGYEWLKVPVRVQRLLVAEDDKLYAPLTWNGPICELDAATGEVIRQYDESEGTTEIICAGGMLLAMSKTGLKAFEEDSGRPLWRRDGLPASLSLAARSGRACAILDGQLRCLDLTSGKELWKAAIPQEAGDVRKVDGRAMVVMQDRFIIVVDDRRLLSLNAETGALLCDAGATDAAFRCPPEAFVIDGLVWSGAAGKGLDPLTARTVRNIRTGHTGGMHVRCYMRKATTRYILGTGPGVDFFDISGKTSPQPYNWLRGVCRLGIVPANGLIYAAPHSCRCQAEAGMRGFRAFSAVTPREKGSGTFCAQHPSGRSGKRYPTPFPSLEKGPAFGNVARTKAAESDWPCYRGDARRSGICEGEAPQDLKQTWSVRFPSRITPPVSVCSKVFVAESDAHTIHCLDGRTGGKLWRYTAEGRVDSPPTYYDGMLLFGTRNGWLYALNAETGQLAWRYACTPQDWLVGASDQIQSAFPVCGSVLVQGGVVYAAAGLSSLLYGGITLVGLDPFTGNVIHHTRVQESTAENMQRPAPRYWLDGPRNKTVQRNFSGEDRASYWHLDGAQNDILVSDGHDIYLRTRQFDDKLVAQPDRVRHTVFHSYVTGTGLRLYASSGLLDTSWHNRAYWAMGANYGQLLVFDDTVTHGVKVYRRKAGLSNAFDPATDGYLLFAAPTKDIDRRAEFKDVFPRINLSEEHTWAQKLKHRIRAMAGTPSLLFAAGAIDTSAGSDPLAGLEERSEASLLVLSRKQGEKLAEYHLAAAPEFDGLIIARHRVYMSLKDNSLVCWASGKREQ